MEWNLGRDVARHGRVSKRLSSTHLDTLASVGRTFFKCESGGLSVLRPATAYSLANPPPECV